MKAVALATATTLALGHALALSAQQPGSFPVSGPGAELAGRVAAVEAGTVRFAYALKPGVEICDKGVQTGGDVTWRPGDRDGRGVCVADGVEVDVEVRDGVVVDVDVVRPGEARSSGIRADLGVIEAGEAAGFLLGLARSGATEGAAEDAIFPATIADVEVWRDLLDLARDRALNRGVRKSALFWVGQAASDAATAGLSEVALADDEEQEIREAAIFALSRRPEHQAIASLIEIARAADQPESRRTAMFWLAQSEDERVVEFFEEVLSGRDR